MIPADSRIRFKMLPPVAIFVVAAVGLVAVAVEQPAASERHERAKQQGDEEDAFEHGESPGWKSEGGSSRECR